MDKRMRKFVTFAVVYIVVIGGLTVCLAAGVFSNNSSSDNEINLIGRVNVEGSGLFLKEGESTTNYMTVQTTEPAVGSHYIKVADNTYYVFNVANWGGKIFGTPGTATIQHIQLQDVVQNTLGLKFEMYQTSFGDNLSSDTVYFTQTASYAAFCEYLSGEAKLNKLVGALIWEAQYSLALRNGCTGLFLTNDVFDGHTCCVIAGSHSWMNSHVDGTARFLAAYIECVEKLNYALSNPTSQEYKDLLDVAVNSVAIPDKYADTPEKKKAVIEDSLKNVTYVVYDEKSDKPLENLKKDVSKLSGDLYDLKAVKNSVKDLGFENGDAFAAKYIDDKYMAKAIAKNYTVDSTVNITVAVISGDVHQLAMHYGISLGIFAGYGINITLSPQTNGPAVSVAVSNGGAEFGFVGAPPMTIAVMNESMVKA